MAAGIDSDPAARGNEGACAQLEFLCYCAEPEEFSCRKRKKREESPAFRRTVVYKSNYVLGVEPRQEKMRHRIGFDNMCCRKFERMPVAAGTPPSLSAFFAFPEFSLHKPFCRQ